MQNAELQDVHKDRSFVLWFLFAVSLAGGLFFRFYNLEKKVFWHDETITSMRLSGYTKSELNELIFSGRELRIEDFQKFQGVNSKHDWIDTIKSLTKDDPKQAPLYYVLLRIWIEFLGDSIRSIRGFSALISILAFPCIYLICKLLFETSRTAWMAVALMSASPLHVLYAQEARPYSLWTLMILLSSAALLFVLKKQTGWRWALYSVTVAAGLYSHTLFGLVIASHAGYVVVRSFEDLNGRTGLPKTIIHYFIALIAALLAFAPWALIIVNNFSRVFHQTLWVAKNAGIFQLLGRWAVGLSSVFYDPGYDFGNILMHLPRIIFLVLALYSVYFAWSRSPRRISLFILVLMLVPVLAMKVPDLLLGGRLISTPRFLIPLYLGVQIAVAYLLSTKAISFKNAAGKAWSAISMIIILCGFVSCAISSQAVSWWTKSSISADHPQVASIINGRLRPLLICDLSGNDPHNIISLCYLLDHKVRFQFVHDSGAPLIQEDSGDLFLYNPAAFLQRSFESGGSYQVEPVFKSSLWLMRQRGAQSPLSF
jgi:uncharacterized membrane protein